MKTFLTILCAALLGRQDTPKPDDSTLQKVEREVAAVVAKVRPSVVSVTARFSLKPNPQIEASETLNFSGVVYRKDGYVVTDASGVAEAEEIKVALSDDRTFAAKLVAADPRTGIAVLHVDADDLTPVEPAESKEIKAGLFAIAVGNPFGLKGTASMGYVSGLDRTIVVAGARYENMIQMSTPVNPGDCGGLLTNSHGRLLGIVNSTYQADLADKALSGLFNLFGKDSKSLIPANPNSISFAIHADTVRFVADRIIKYKRMVRGRLGVSVRMIDATTRKQLEIEEGVGAAIVRVESKSPARKGGLRRNDILVAYDGEPIKDPAVLKSKVESLLEPKTVKIVYYRGGQKVEAEVKVELDPLGK